MVTRRSKQSSGVENVLIDLGFPDAEELSAKAELAMRINEILDERHLTQRQAGAVLHMPQPKVSAIRNYKLRGISLERLLIALVALDRTVEISVRRASRKRVGIRVAA